ncbi:lysoplasmalogenase [Pedobacter psychroterrae]|uniref:Lysoplasmalogenase n=1 Tax=Pedobacter psychroterrae TaxID=2530453 RepID=A0A4R0NJX6_9SPHI|nr:lysoplasmalogenase [Pedobacter psychroterrae]TCD00138.1 lysoplasmalogenase [Pedobacter psychroterrae]
MLKKYPKFNLLFALIFILHLIAISNGSAILQYITKPLIVVSLMAMLAISTSLKGRFHKRLFTGLFFALSGDVLLMFSSGNQAFFIYGLIAFLIGHIFYISAFYLDFSSAPELDKKGARIAILVCAVIGMGFYIYIRESLGILKLPVMVYIFVISFMMMMASFRNLRVNVISFRLILVGAMFFLISDSLLAYNKFAQPFNYAHLLIMATYMTAQYLITIGGIERKLIATQ